MNGQLHQPLPPIAGGAGVDAVVTELGLLAGRASWQESLRLGSMIMPVAIVAGAADASPLPSYMRSATLAAAGAGQFGGGMLYNPLNSGKLLYVDFASVVNDNANARGSLWLWGDVAAVPPGAAYINTATVGVPKRYDVPASADVGVGQIWTWVGAGNPAGTSRAGSKRNAEWEFSTSGVVTLRAGRGIVIKCEIDNQAVHSNFEWREGPA